MWVDKDISCRIRQGDIFSDIEYIEWIRENDGILEYSKIKFPLAMVMSQDCDLERDYEDRNTDKSSGINKQLLSIIVVPMYNEEYFRKGEHLENLKLKMESFSPKDTKFKDIKKNLNPRYHFLEASPNLPSMQPQVIDFKHYFTVQSQYLESIKNTSFKCKVKELFRESISQRFAYYLSRIGLPLPPIKSVPDGQS